MKIIESVISMERKYNLGNYETVSFFQSVKFAPETGDDLKNLCKQTQDFIIEQIKQHKETYKTRSKVKTL